MWKIRKIQKDRLDREKGTIVKDWGGKFSVGLVFPNRYYLGMSNLGFQTVYRLFNSLESVVCERFFFPELREQQLFEQKNGVPLSVESQRRARDFDIIVFSVPFESDYTNVLQMLLWSKIPIRSSERDNHHPLIAMGGVASFLNPDVMSEFMDFFFIGEGEIFWKTFWDFFRDNPPSGNRKKWLEELATSVDGIYVPEFYTQNYKSDGTIAEFKSTKPGIPEKIKVQKADTSTASLAYSAITTSDTEFSNTRLVEISRGCGRGCRFCAAGYIYRPPRIFDADKIISLCLSEVESGPSRIGLVSAAVGDHPQIDKICETLGKYELEVSFSSLRADSIKRTILNLLISGRHQAVAIAPEAGSERLRRVINKHLTDDQICEASVKLTESGIRHLKLYFMIGLPTEEQEDIEAIVRLVKKIKHEIIKTARGIGNLGEIIVNVNSFVPKPFTPFQWESFNDVDSLKKKIKHLKRNLSRISNVRFHADLPKWSYVQALLARGDRRVGQFVEMVVTRKISWQMAMKHSAFNPDFWVYRKREKEEKLPWDIIDHGIKKSFLWEEYQNALKARETPGCYEVDNCRRCGVCNVYSLLVYR